LAILLTFVVALVGCRHAPVVAKLADSPVSPQSRALPGHRLGSAPATAPNAAQQASIPPAYRAVLKPNEPAQAMQPPVPSQPPRAPTGQEVTRGSLQFVSSTTIPAQLAGGSKPTPELSPSSETIDLPAAAEAVPPAAAVAATPLTLPAAIETSLEQNPDLVALRQTEGVSRAVVGVARSFPFNPFFQFQATPVEQAPASAKSSEPNAAQKIYQYYLVMHTFELAHQRKHREAAAMAQLGTVRWNIFQAELQNIALTEQLFVVALYQRGLRDLANASARLSTSLLSALEKQLAAGQAAASDVATARMDARATRQQARLAEANYQTALLGLRRQLNLPATTAIEPAGALSDLEWMPVSGEHLSRVPSLSRAVSAGDGMEKIISELASGRPDVLAARSTAAAAKANRDLARASRIPNLLAGPYYQSDDFGIKYFGFRGQVDIPVVNTGKPLVRQRNAELRLQQVTAQQLRTRAEQEVRAAIERYERARQMAAESAGDLGEGMPVELQRLEQQFQAGEIDMMRIFTARTSLLQLRRAYLDALNEVGLAAAGVTAASGLPPDALIRVAATPLPPPLPPVPPVPPVSKPGFDPKSSARIEYLR
jgi:outer membrane protein, heavy metal efflux system